MLTRRDFVAAAAGALGTSVLSKSAAGEAAKVSGGPLVLFQGDSITDAWQQERFNFFQGKPYADRGISGQTTPQMLLNVLEFGMNIQEAIEAPRVRVYRDRLVDVEARVPAETRAALADRGHQVNVIDDWSWIVGGGQGIVRDPESGVLMAGADPRRDGYALCV